MPQLAYSTTLAPAVAGMKADAGYDRVASKVNLNAGAIAFGVFVKPLTTTYMNGVDVLGLIGDVVAGITVKSEAHPIDGLAGVNDNVPTLGIVDVMETGAVWAMAEQVMVPGDVVYARYGNSMGGAGTLTNIRGIVRKDADTTSARIVKGARVLRNGVAPSGQQLVCLYFDRESQNVNP